jgi:hypothetical protein
MIQQGARGTGIEQFVRQIEEVVVTRVNVSWRRDVRIHGVPSS